MNTITFPTPNGGALRLTVPDGPVGYQFLPPPGEEVSLSDLADILLTSIQEQRTMNAELASKIDALKADVAAEREVSTSATKLIAGMAQQIADALAKAEALGATPEQLQSLADLDTQIKGSTADLSAAVTANTPAAPAEPTPAPVPEQPPVAVDPVPVSTEPAPTETPPVAEPVPAVAEPAPVDPSAPTGEALTPTAE